MYRIFLICFCLFSCFCDVFASSCVEYKSKPKINLFTPDYVKTVVQPVSPMNLYHGNVVATLIDDYEILVDVQKVSDGFCIILKSVDATIGYNDFNVNIDIRNKPNSCSYNAILKHEDEHINSYLSIIDSMYNDIKNSVFSASNSIMPVFIKSYDDVKVVVNDMNKKLREHPDLVLMKQMIYATEELKNKKVDEENKEYEILKHCND